MPLITDLDQKIEADHYQLTNISPPSQLARGQQLWAKERKISDGDMMGGY